MVPCCNDGRKATQGKLIAHHTKEGARRRREKEHEQETVVRTSLFGATCCKNARTLHEDKSLGLMHSYSHKPNRRVSLQASHKHTAYQAAKTQRNRQENAHMISRTEKHTAPLTHTSPLKQHPPLWPLPRLTTPQRARAPFSPGSPSPSPFSASPRARSRSGRHHFAYRYTTRQHNQSRETHRIRRAIRTGKGAHTLCYECKTQDKMEKGSLRLSKCWYLVVNKWKMHVRLRNNET